jgi:DNA invertase Pin-like site-specific DNA recombinase
MTPHKLRTAIYARVSTLDQDPAMQLRELRAYAAHRRLPITAELGY